MFHASLQETQFGFSGAFQLACVGSGQAARHAAGLIHPSYLRRAACMWSTACAGDFV